MCFNNYALILNLHLKVDEEYHRGIFKYFKGNNRRGAIFAIINIK